MANDKQDYPVWEDPGMPSNQPKPPEPEPDQGMFRRNSSGVGFRPRSWKGWVVIVGIVILVIILRFVIRAVM